MTPQERQLVAGLFERLETLERNRRDPDAEAAIAEGARRAPHALYALVQTVLVQDEALRAADARIRALEGGGETGQGGFLDSMRDTFLGRRDEVRGSVPPVRGTSGRQGGPAPQAGAGQGGSFLGTAAASAAGVIGGALLLNSFRTLFGGTPASALDKPGGAEQASPWGGDAAKSDLAREAGVNDIGGDKRSGLFDTAAHEPAESDYGDDGSDDFDIDFGGDSDFG
ncbi:MAG: DUF2076 domain-containing protein [Pseudorhodoplanes sp.]